VALICPALAFLATISCFNTSFLLFTAHNVHSHGLTALHPFVPSVFYSSLKTYLFHSRLRTDVADYWTVYSDEAIREPRFIDVAGMCRPVLYISSVRSVLIGAATCSKLPPVDRTTTTCPTFRYTSSSF